MREINYCPSTLAVGYNTYSPQACHSLFEDKEVSPHLDFTFSGLKGSTNIELAMQRISVSGVQEKFPALIDAGRIRLAEAGERSTHILKPAPWDETIATRKQIPANEHLTMQIASQVYGIRTAGNGLCFDGKGQMVYITHRFDIAPDGMKLEMEDFATLIGRNEQTDGKHFKYDGCYEDIATAIKEYIPEHKEDLVRFFELVVFNYIYGNGDAHLKNFSIIREKNGYHLTPAYDLLNTSLHVNGDDFGLDDGFSPNIEKSDIYERSGHPCRIDFERFGHQIGLSPSSIQNILNKYKTVPESAQVLVARSFLNEKLKRSYLRVVKERISRFVRDSE